MYVFTPFSVLYLWFGSITTWYSSNNFPFLKVVLLQNGLAPKKLFSTFFWRCQNVRSCLFLETVRLDPPQWIFGFEIFLISFRSKVPMSVEILRSPTDKKVQQNSQICLLTEREAREFILQKFMGYTDR